MTNKKDSKNFADRLLELEKMLVRFSEIERLIFFPDNKKLNRRENDVEHSFSLAICAWYLSQFFPKLNQEKILKFSLAHDFVEIHAGDVMAIGRTKSEQEQKNEREKLALEQLKNEWPDFSNLTDTISEYEDKVSKEAQFVCTLDKILPVLLNIISDGKTWKHHNFSKQDIYSNKDKKMKLSPEINDIWLEIKKIIDDNPGFFKDQTI